MQHDSILGVKLLLRQFQNIFLWWMKWKNLDSLSCVKLFGQWNCEIVWTVCCVQNLHKLFLWIKWWNLDHYSRFWETDFCTYCLCEPIWIIIVWVNRFFYVDKFVEQIFFMCTNLLNRFFIFFLIFYVNIFFAQVLDHYCLGEHIFFIKFPLNRFFYRLNRFKKEKKEKKDC